MSRSRWMVTAGVLTVAAVAALMLLTRPAGLDEASSISRRSGGLLLARKYLEARGLACTTWTDPVPADGPRTRALLLAFPATQAPLRGELHRLARWVRRGGTLVLLFDPAAPGPVQRRALDALDLATHTAWRETELDPFEWWRRAHTPLKLDSPAGAGRVVLSSSVALALRPRDGDRILLEDPGTNTVLGLERTVGRGTLLVLPSECLSNGRLLEGGNAGLLEWLRRRLAPSGGLAFDERIHGLGAPAPREAEGTPMADALLAQLALLYLLTVLALARRQGPAWPDEAARGSSVGGLLLRLGAVHRRMGHHREAGRAMVERAAALGGWERVPREIEELRQWSGPDGAGLLSLATAVARRQAMDRRKERA